MNYKRSKYYTTSKKRKIKYFFMNNKSKITMVFFHGFMSDMIGTKPKTLQSYCKRQKLNYLRFEYSGHGKSSGKFIEGNISKWTDDAKQLIKAKLSKSKNLIFIGSSMGSWIALNLLPLFKNNVKGFLGISSAPEFLQELMWKNFSKKIKKNILQKKIYNLNHGNFTYPLTKQLIWDGKKNKIFNKKTNIRIPVVLFHSIKDKVVPVKFSRKILKVCSNSKSKLIKIKNGDHSLSRKSDLKKICREIDNLITNCT